MMNKLQYKLLDSDDSYHIMTDVNLAAAAALWYAAIAAAYY